MRSRAFVGAVLVPLAWIVACGGGSGDPNGAATADSFVDQYCATFAPCCEKAGRPTDGATCRVFVGAAAGSREYDAAQGSLCLEELRAGAAKPDFCETLQIEAPACEKVYSRTSGGTVAPGGTCNNDEDCAAPTDGVGEPECVSRFVEGAESRVCQIRVEGKEGDTPCIGTKDGNVTSFGGTGNETPPRAFICDTADGVRCDTQERKCVKLAAVGEPCERGGSSACVKNAYCDTTQKCVERLPVGASCAEAGLSTACTETAYCDATEKKCIASLATGAACTRNEQCASRRCVNNKCDPSSSSSFGLALLCGGG